MKKVSKPVRTTSVFLALVMALTLFAGTAFAAEPQETTEAADKAVYETETAVPVEFTEDTGREDFTDDPVFDFGNIEDLNIKEGDDYDVVVEDMEITEDTEDEEDEDASLAIEAEDEDSDSEEALLEDDLLPDAELQKEEEALQAEIAAEEASEGTVYLSQAQLLEDVEAMKTKLAAEGTEYNGFVVTLSDDAKNMAKGDPETRLLEYTENTCVADSGEAIINDYDYTDVTNIEPNYISYLEGETVLADAEEETEVSDPDSAANPNDPYFQWGYQRNLDQIHVPYAWKKGLSGQAKNGRKVVVAVIDSGLYPWHQDFRSSHILSGKDFTSSGGYSNDIVGHGTACASVIMATRNNGYGITGVAPNVYVLPLKVFGYRGSTDDATITEAINYARWWGVDVISMSLSGYGYTSAKKRACDNAYKKGIIVVASAGNSDTYHYATTYPAGFSSVIGVGSVDRYNYKSSFSQCNSKSVYCTAPGENIYVCGTSYSSYTTMSGTSFSCPTVAAIAALAKSVSKRYTGYKFKSLLRKTCKDLGSYGKDPDYGYGLVNVTAITKKLLPAKKIRINKKKVSLAAGKSLRLRATVYPKSAAVRTVRWKTSNAKVVRVSSKGKIRALRYGKATITAIAKGNKKLKAKCKVTVLFKDVAKKSLYYYKPVYWAAKKGITGGVTKSLFGANRVCTRKQMVIFLWKMAGKPKAYGSLRFKDVKVKRSSDTYKAILWATKKGIIKGYKGNKFKPNGQLTRKQAVMMLYRYAGKPRVSGSVKFKDMKKYKKRGETYKAVLWGVKKGIIGGYSNHTFRPSWLCRRSHVISFLYRYKH